MRTLLMVALTGIALTSVARAGTYGDVSRNFKGFTLTVDCGVGYMKDHANEAKLFAEKKAAAEKTLDQYQAALLGMIKHFTDGRHPFAQHLDWLDREQTKADYDKVVRIDVRIPSTGDNLIGPRPIRLVLYTKSTLTLTQQQRLAMDFAGSVMIGGAFAKLPLRVPADAADTQQLLLGMGSQLKTDPVSAVRMFAERRAEIVALAQMASPLPKKYAWQGDQRSALEAARAIVAWLAQQPLPDSVYGSMHSLPPDSLDELVQLVAMLSPDLPSLRRLRATLAEIKSPPPNITALLQWIDGLLAV